MEVRLENIANIFTGKCNVQDAVKDGKYPLFDRSGEIKKSNDYFADCEAIIVPGESTTFIPRYHKGKFNLHQRAYCIEPKSNVNGVFLYYYILLNHSYFSSVATGSTVASLRLNNFLKMKINLPKLEKQNIIANILSNYDSLIEINNKRIQILEEEAQELFKEWFVRFRFNNREETRFVDGVPEGWNYKKIINLVTEKKQKLKQWENLDILDLSNMPSFSWNISDCAKGTDFKSNIYKLDAFDLVFGSIRPYLGKGGFAPFDGGICGTVFSFEPTKKEYYSYLLCLITSKNFFEYANTVTKGTKMPIIDFSDIQKYKANIPEDIKIFKEFNNLVLPLIKEVKNLIYQNKNLACQRNLLLPRLMSGELEV